MARPIPTHRLRDLVHVATAVLIRAGYHRTQMADVARELGLGKGTLYGYVEGKGALFYLALAYADRDVPIEVPAELPVPNPRPGALRQLFSERIAALGHMPTLAAALGREAAVDIGSELEAIARELFAALGGHRTWIKLMERCAVEIPELAEVWRRSGRHAEVTALERYLTSRIDAGQLVDCPDHAIAARIFLETVTTWAVHIHWDRNPDPFDSSVAEESVVALLRRGFILEASQHGQA
jgi:AcrR family transcriptional regulator